MAKNAAITIRIPDSLKRLLESRARTQHRSLSAQVVADLETILAETPPVEARGRLLGVFAGTPIPTDDDVKEGRSLLWGTVWSSSRRGMERNERLRSAVQEKMRADKRRLRQLRRQEAMEAYSDDHENVLKSIEAVDFEDR